jgi:glutaconate CoA-transferase subunit B
VWEPDPRTKEFTVVSIHRGATAQQVRETCGWPVRFASDVAETPPPTPLELGTLRDLNARTAAAHGTVREE